MNVNFKLCGKAKRMFFRVRPRGGWNVVLAVLCLLLMKYLFFIGLFGEDQSRSVSFITFSIHGEDLKKINSSFARLYVNYGINTMTVESVQPIENDSREPQITYAYESTPESEVIQWGSSKSLETNERLEKEKDLQNDLFQIISKPTGHCPKLYRSGGDLVCRNFNETKPVMDGHKYICLDQPLQVITGSPKPSDCLVLSFGVNMDISFDIALRDANCVVNMFDTDEYLHSLAEEDEYVNFYQVGLSHERINEYISNEDRMIKLDTFNNLAFDYGFADRLVNILKIDIEGDEWEVLKDMVTKPYLDVIGQIAVEVHNLNLKTMNETAQKDWVESGRELFLAFQKRGFQRISYFNNLVAKKNLVTERGSYYNAAELLLVNSMWYNKQFRAETRRKGFNFMPL